MSWSLNGIGSLSAASGSTVNYVPPTPSHVTSTASITITASAGNVKASSQIEIDPAPGNTWQVLQYPDGDWSQVKLVNGQFLAIESEAMLASSDGVTWSPVTLPSGEFPVDIAYGGDKYVLTSISADGNATLEMFYSSNLVSWSSGSIAAATDGTGLIPSALEISFVVPGNAVYVGAGVQGIITSSDGINWLSRTGPVVGGLNFQAYSLAFGNGVFVIRGASGTYYSSDGVNWTAATNLPYGPGVVFGNGNFVATTAANNQSYTSPDAINWTLGGSMTGSAGTFAGSLSFGNGTYFSYTPTNAGYSTDGVHWTQMNAPYQQNASLSVYMQGIAANATNTVMVGTQGLFQYSPNLAHWTSPSIGFYPPMGIGIGPADCMNGVCVVLIGDTSFLRSTDAIHWTRHALAGAGTNIVTITHGNGQFVIVDSNLVCTSPDGENWTCNAVNMPNDPVAAAYGNGHFVMVGFGDFVLTSTDGVNWTTGGSGITPAGSNAVLVQIAFGNGTFIAIASNGDIYSSPDGQQWTAGPTGAPHGALAYGTGVGFVAAGDTGTVLRSVDGINWQSASTPALAKVNVLSYGDRRYLAAGADGILFTSDDAVTWTATALPVQPGIGGVAFTGSAFILAGTYGFLAASMQ